MGDEGPGATPWWYPYETQGGAMMEGRVVLPLPPEVQWHEATPVVLPGAERRAAEERLLEDKLGEVEKREREAKKKTRRGGTGGGVGGGSGGGVAAGSRGLVAPRAVGVGGFGVGSGFGEPANEARTKASNVMAPDEAEVERLKQEKAEAKKALRAAQRKNDPALVDYARELRDRWQEHVTAGGPGEGMLENKQRGRYAVGRLIESSGATGQASPGVVEEGGQMKGLPRAA